MTLFLFIKYVFCANKCHLFHFMKHIIFTVAARQKILDRFSVDSSECIVFREVVEDKVTLLAMCFCNWCGGWRERVTFELLRAAFGQSNAEIIIIAY
jgi:hypothetical protein